MRQIFTYPLGEATQFVDYRYIGTSTTNGFAKRVADVMDGTYKTWQNTVVPGTAETDYTDYRNFIARHYALFDWWGYATTVTRNSMYYLPMIMGGGFTQHGCTTVDILGTDSMYFRTSGNHGLYTGQQMTASGFTSAGYTQYNGSDFYVEKINSKVFRLATDNSSGPGIDGGGADNFLEKTTWAFGVDMAIAEDKSIIAAADPAYDETNDPLITTWIYSSGDDRYEVADSIRPTGVLDVAAATWPTATGTRSPYPYWNKLGASGLKLNSDGTRLFAHAYDVAAETAYIAYYTRSGLNWTLANTWTLPNNNLRVRFDINEAGDTIAIRTSGTGSVDAKLLIETESGGTWTNRKTLNLGVRYWGEVQLDDSGDYCVVERAGSEVKFLYTTDNWVTDTTGAWHDVDGSILSYDHNNDVMALWQSGGTVRFAASPYSGTGWNPSFYDYNPGTDTLTLEGEFEGFAANVAIKWNAAGDTVLWTNFDEQIPGTGDLADYDRKIWAYTRDGSGTWTLEDTHTNGNYQWAPNWQLKLRDATSDLTMVRQESRDDVHNTMYAQVAQYVGGTTTKSYVIPDVDYVFDELYSGSKFTEAVTLTPASTEPFPYKTTAAVFRTGGNIQYGYKDYNQVSGSQDQVGADIRMSNYIRAGATTSSGSNPYPATLYSTIQEQLPRLLPTVNANGRIGSVPFDSEYPGAFSADHDTVAYLFQSQGNLGLTPTTSIDYAAQEDVFDTQDHWDTSSYVSGPSESEGKVWPTHVKPKAIRLSVNAPTVTTRSQNGTKYVRDLGFQKITMEVDYPPMTQTEFDEFMSKVQLCRGGTRPFWFDLRGTDGQNNIFAYKGSSNNVSGHYLAESNTDGDKVFTIEGFDSNETNVVKYNTTFSNYNLAPDRQGQVSFAANEVDANIYGEVKVRLTYPMKNINAGERIYFAPAYVVCTLVDDNTDFDIGDSRYTGFTIRMELDEFK